MWPEFMFADKAPFSERTNQQSHRSAPYSTMSGDFADRAGETWCATKVGMTEEIGRRRFFARFVGGGAQAKIGTLSGGIHAIAAVARVIERDFCFLFCLCGICMARGGARFRNSWWCGKSAYGGANLLAAELERAPDARHCMATRP